MDNRMGAQLHTVVKSDPLELRAVKLDVGVWAHPSDEVGVPPAIGSKILVVYNEEEDKWYWLGALTSVEYVGWGSAGCSESIVAPMCDYEPPPSDIDDADWWKQ
jgi:hypothetical protein